ncbi:LysR family transcriptional regulator [Maritalea sp.]|uniref:LysR family transcriptional regulator n=1 Tax=Maritalea sp. TaxID=2003361 RepID=UPI003F4AE419
MDWRATTFDWNRTRAFLVAAEEGSLSAAARALGLAQPTLGRQVEALEAELGLTLFERDGRGIVLTPSGVELLEHARAMGAAAMQFSLSAHGQSQAIEGDVSIAASETIAAVMLPPIVAKLRTQEPGIEVEIVVSNNASDLARREADIAIRHFRPAEPDLYARKIKDMHTQIYATPAYLDKVGNPKSLEELNRASFISLDKTNVVMQGLNANGMSLTEKNFPVMTQSYLVMWELVKQGVGIGVLDATIGDKEPLVQRVLPDFNSIKFPMWLVAHRELKTSRRIRRVFDFLAEELAKI